ncbi:MAG: hypothetical protein AB8B92_02305 [Gammaproteobacteria bacterium]
MIRNIITAAILLAALVSITSIMQLAHAVEPDLNLEISAYKDNLATSNFSHPFAWTPDMSQQNRFIKLYERFVLPESIGPSGLIDDGADSNQRLFSFEIYQGDGLDDLRQQSKHHNRITLPDEDTEAYGVSVKQRF